MSCLIILLALFTFSLEARGQIEWFHNYGATSNDNFGDVFLTARGNFATAGGALDDGNEVRRRRNWLCVINPEGRPLIDCRYESLTTTTQTIIESDNGEFLIGCTNGGGGSFFAFLTDPDGNIIWENAYANQFGGCNAVIELKDGNFLLAGYSIYTRNNVQQRDNGVLVKIDRDGEVIWLHDFGDNTRETFNSMREVEEGVVLAGFDDFDGWLVKVDSDGELAWERTYSLDELEGNAIEMLHSLIVCRNGDFVMVGARGAQQWALRTLNNGDQIWSRYYSGFGAGGLLSAVEMPDGGFTMVGHADADSNGHEEGLYLRTDRDGLPLWYLNITPERTGIMCLDLKSVILVPGDLVLAAGTGRPEDGMGAIGMGLLLAVEQDRFTPLITEWSPEDLTQQVLVGDVIDFEVRAVNPTGDVLHYFWLVDGDTVSTDSTTAIDFSDFGEYRVSGIASDQTGSDEKVWTVEATNLFIQTHSPDTLSLSLRRGTAQTFSLDTVRAVEGDPVEYQWTLTNLDNFEREEAGTETSATIKFLRSGNYQMEGLAYRGESWDNVIWTITVRSAILDFWPRELNLSVPPDSSGEFGVIPFNPESDSLSYRWEVDGDSVGSDSTVTLRFVWDDRRIGNPPHLVAAIVMDGMEGDTVRWEVTVQDPNAPPPTPPSLEGGKVPATFGIVSVSPNPFNNSTTISFTVPFGSEAVQSAKSAVRLTVHDLTGREVARLVDERAQQSPPSRGGPYAVTFDASDLPAGIYLVKLQAGERQKVAKVVLVR